MDSDIEIPSPIFLMQLVLGRWGTNKHNSKERVFGSMHDSVLNESLEGSFCSLNSCFGVSAQLLAH